MEDDDYRDIFDFVRIELVQNGLADVNTRIIDDLDTEDHDAFGLLRDYLVMLLGQISLGSETSHGRAMERFQAHTRTKDGQPIAGIRLVVTDEDRLLADIDYVDLLPDPDCTEAANELRELIEDLFRDYRSSRQNRGSENE